MERKEGANLANRLAGGLGARDLLLVRHAGDNRRREVPNRQVTNGRTDAESRYAIGVEVLVAKVRLDDRR